MEQSVKALHLPQLQTQALPLFKQLLTLLMRKLQHLILRSLQLLQQIQQIQIQLLHQ